MFSTLTNKNFNFLVTIILSFANALHLEYWLFKILSFSKELKLILFLYKKKCPFYFPNVPKFLPAMRHLSQTFFNLAGTLDVFCKTSWEKE